MKNVLITGANSGIGLETARALAGDNYHVIMACRSASRAEEAKADILSTHPNASLDVVSLDLASFQSIREAAESVKSKIKTLDVLVNNAGLAPPSQQYTKEGFELQFGVNYLGHFLLTQELLPLLKAAEHARVVNVASMIHRVGSINFNSFKGSKWYFVLKAYGQSKLANVLFSNELARRYKNDGISSVSLHPGEVGTNIAGRSWLRRTGYKLIGAYMSPQSGAKTSIYLSTVDDIQSLTGKYFNKKAKAVEPSKKAKDAALAKRLWEASESLVNA